MRSFRSESKTTTCWMKCGIAVLTGVLLLSGALPAQNSVADPQTQKQAAPTLSITTREVLLDVVVTENGQPVTGLKASDFVVSENGKLQKIASLEEHGPMQPQQVEVPALEPNTFTNYTPVANTNAYTVILLDALNTRLEDQMWLRIALVKYLRQRPTGAPVAIFVRDTKMRLVQGFSPDAKVLLAAAESERNRPSLPTTVRGTREEYLEYRLDQVAIGFALMGRYLAAFPGRKNLIWFVGALPGSEMLAPMGNPFNDEFKILEGDPHDLTAELTLSRVAVYPVDARPLRAAPQYTAQSNGVPAANGPVQFETTQAFQHLALDSIAESTGGLSYYNSNGVGEKISEIESNGARYYTLTYATTNKDWNGDFRRIKIELNRPNVKLQYRQGYYGVDRTKDEKDQLAQIERAKQAQRHAAGGAKDQTAAQQHAAAAETAKNPPPPKEGFEEAMQLGAIPPTEVVFTAHATEGTGVMQIKKNEPWPQDNYLAADYKYKPFRVYTVEFAVDANTLHATKGPDGMWRGSVTFVSVVYDQTAQNVNSKSTTKTFELDDTLYQNLVEHGLIERQEIAVPEKGNYFLRLGVHSLPNDRVGTLEFAVDQVKANVPAAIAQTR
jgi:VWFA-related protein